ncbi:hypothetical protein PGT21_029867 [Puccinia graminis f. sp. tritici]|uniref:Uncharacterized protein n=1 Tax=Puccinia graminis f. sp. tritici TaxID=56615 RepID=A0A5B0QP66_PUCGR|nr:hypothetical protein PGT21_029867 [Puccinia graminis f. sp. tritici]
MEQNLSKNLPLKTELSDAFNKAINNSGTSACWEALSTAPPSGFLVDGSSEIDLPLGEEQVRQLIAQSTSGALWPRRRDNHGHGKSAQTNSSSSSQLGNLQGCLVDLSKVVAVKLGIDEPIRSDFYMLILEKGATFKPRTSLD